MNQINTRLPVPREVFARFGRNNLACLVLFLFVHIFILPLLFNTIFSTPYSSIGLYYSYAGEVLNGNLPYRDFVFEYPPLALLFFLLPHLFSSSYETFSILYQVEILLFDLAGIYLFYRISLKQGWPAWKSLLIYTLSVVACGPIIANSYDIFPAILTLAALYCFWTDRHRISWIMLGLGVMTKIFPIVVAPLIIIHYLINHDYRRIWQGILTLTATCLAVLLPVIITSPNSLMVLVNYHSQRGVQLESSYSSLLLLAGKIGWLNIELNYEAGSWNIGGQISSTLALFSSFLLIAALLLLYWFIFAYSKRVKTEGFKLGSYSLVAFSILLVTSKILSPQYLIWLAPLLPFAEGRYRWVTWTLFILAGAMTYYIFPLHYMELLWLDSGTIAVLVSRNILLVALVLLSVVSLYRSRSASQTASSPDNN